MDHTDGSVACLCPAGFLGEDCNIGELMCWSGDAIERHINVWVRFLRFFSRIIPCHVIFCAVDCTTPTVILDVTLVVGEFNPWTAGPVYIRSPNLVTTVSADTLGRLAAINLITKLCMFQPKHLWISVISNYIGWPNDVIQNNRLDLTKYHGASDISMLTHLLLGPHISVSELGSALVQIMACRLFGAKPLSKPTPGQLYP